MAVHFAEMLATRELKELVLSVASAESSYCHADYYQKYPIPSIHKTLT